jgi:hypothetical protein
MFVPFENQFLFVHNLILAAIFVQVQPDNSVPLRQATQLEIWYQGLYENRRHRFEINPSIASGFSLLTRCCSSSRTVPTRHLRRILDSSWWCVLRFFHTNDFNLLVPIQFRLFKLWLLLVQFPVQHWQQHDQRRR